MIPILLMVLGGILVIISFLGLIIYIFEPLYKNFRIVIRREDDYAHYTTPDTFVILQKARRSYCMGLLVMFLAGAALFFSGYYMRFGSRGMEMLFSLEEEEEALPEGADRPDGLSQDGSYYVADGAVYDSFIRVRGDVVYFKDEKIGSADRLAEYLDTADLDRETPLYLVDDYASYATFHKVITVLNENGFHYEMADEE